MDPNIIDQIREARFPLDTTIRGDSVLHTLQHRAGSYQEIFSQGSEYMATQGVAQIDSAPHISWSIALALTVLLCLYCWMIYRYRKPIVACLKALFSLEDAFFIFENTPTEFKHFLSTSRSLLLFSVSIVTVGSSMDSQGGFGQLAMIAAVMAYLYVSILLQNLLRTVVSRFDSAAERIGILRSLTLLDLSTMSVVFAPLALLSVSVGGMWVVVWSVLVVLVLVHWLRLFFYFKLTGFSILQWILYLCTLEVLPFTILLNVIGHIESL